MLKSDNKEDQAIENPFIHPKSKIQQLEQEKLHVEESCDDKFSVTTLDIKEEG